MGRARDEDAAVGSARLNYRKFLGKRDEVVAPWLGAASIDVGDRRLRLAVRPEVPGWYRFEVKQRTAHLLGPTDAPELSALPRVRGFSWGERLVTDGARAELLHLLPDEEAPRFSPITARRWHGGELLFEQREFEAEAEALAREALAKGTPLDAVKGVPASLRAAWAYALAEQVSRRLALPAVAAELRPHLTRIAKEGVAGAEAALHALAAERALAERELRAQRAELAAARLGDEVRAAREQRANTRHAVDERLFDALANAGAALESHRRAGARRVEVVFSFMDTRFISLVDEDTLQVIDSGICLGHPPRDDLVTLESLPSVIKEAIETDALVILRYP